MPRKRRPWIFRLFQAICIMIIWFILLTLFVSVSDRWGLFSQFP